MVLDTMTKFRLGFADFGDPDAERDVEPRAGSKIFDRHGNSPT